MSRVCKKSRSISRRGLPSPSAVRSVTVKGCQGFADARRSRPALKWSNRTSSISRSRPAGDGEGLETPSRGSTRAHLANMVTGVTKGYEKKLELVGVGYRAAVQAKRPYADPGLFAPHSTTRSPDGITHRDADADGNSGQGHRPPERIGQTAAEIRSFRPPEPYKGQGP